MVVRTWDVENPQDRVRRGNAGFTDEEVRHIRKLLDSGTMSARQLAAAYQKGVETIRRIGRRETFGWLVEEPDLSVTASPEMQKRIEGSLEKMNRLLREENDIKAKQNEELGKLEE